ncbi:hypothetical protein HYV64_03675 [Candidatus Shapirobacteria bacterium]|nr:hypothetical protein [Candidatus Shapirobacteria bacterium]
MKIKYALLSFVLFTLASFVILHSFRYVNAESLAPSGQPITPTPTIIKVSTPPANIPPSQVPPPDSSVEVIRATYGPPNGFVPTQFAVKLGVPLRLEVTATEDGIGCMGSLMIPDFSSQVEFFEKGKTNVIEFIPTSKGLHYITCGMGIPHANLIVK